MRVEVSVECPVPESFRVQKVLGMFDVPPAKKSVERFVVDLPTLEEDWTIGVIVGPSGSGKSTIARQALGNFLYTPAKQRWPKDAAVIDALGEGEVKDVCALLTAVGFSSPPAWIKPYHVLSNGQQFRCDLARALLSKKPVIVFDEYTSVVDRTVAKIGSAAVSKAIRTGEAKRKFVAVTCHYDVVDWLEPDWVLDMASSTLARRRLRRPQITLRIARGSCKAWPVFKKHHYLTGSLAPSARCFYATIDGELVGICAFLPALGKKNFRRVSRIVILPDYQGVGIGGKFLGECCQLMRDEGNAVSITTSHPAMIRHLDRAPHWRVVSVHKNGTPRPGWKATPNGANYRAATGRAVVTARFLGLGRGNA